MNEQGTAKACGFNRKHGGPGNRSGPPSLLRSLRIAFFILCFAVLAGAQVSKHPAGGTSDSGDLVDLAKLDPTIKLDIRYASSRNFTGRKLYAEARAFLRRPAAEALLSVHRWLKSQGFGLVVYDAYRPLSTTRILWDLTPPDKRAFVANPSTGSAHNRGCAVDVGLYDLSTGHEVEMPSAYDELSIRASVTYSGGTVAQRARRDLLRKAMERGGCFKAYPREWWHYNFRNFRNYPILDIPFSAISTPDTG